VGKPITLNFYLLSFNFFAGGICLFQKIVCKVGSMALIRKEDNDINYNIIARLASELHPGMVLVTSGAAEIGRVDYMRRHKKEIQEDSLDAKTDYAAQGQMILMQNYRQFVAPEYSVRQILVEHLHFNDPEKREHIRRLIERAANQGAIPIVNYNDPVSDEENRRWELAHLREIGSDPVECVDNDETAAVLAELISADALVILTSAEGLYADPSDSSTIIPEITADTPAELGKIINDLKDYCHGTSRAGANGMAAKLQYVMRPAMNGTTVVTGSASYRISELLEGSVPRTIISVGIRN
jgi:glutamate 5-kinase